MRCHVPPPRPPAPSPAIPAIPRSPPCQARAGKNSRGPTLAARFGQVRMRTAGIQEADANLSTAARPGCVCACQRSQAACNPSQVSGVDPNASDRRIAISADKPAFSSTRSASRGAGPQGLPLPAPRTGRAVRDTPASLCRPDAEDCAWPSESVSSVVIDIVDIYGNAILEHGSPVSRRANARYYPDAFLMSSAEPGRDPRLASRIV